MQGGPGCASTFGTFYVLGPYSVTDDLNIKPNTGSWSKQFGLLIIDQPIGTGYSILGDDTIPDDMLQVSEDLYTALLAFFDGHADLQHRPFFITGEVRN